MRARNKKALTVMTHNPSLKGGDELAHTAKVCSIVVGLLMRINPSLLVLLRA